MSDLKIFIDDHQRFASQFQLERFVTVKNGGTPYGMYKQACREIAKRSRALKRLDGQRRILLIEIEELEAHGDEKGNAAARKSVINLEMKRDDLAELDETLAETRRELDIFTAQASPLKAQVGELDVNARNRLEQELWEHKLKQRAVIDVVTSGRPGRGTVEAILSLPRDSRDRILSKIGGDPKQLVPWIKQEISGKTQNSG